MRLCDIARKGTVILMSAAVLNTVVQPDAASAAQSPLIIVDSAKSGAFDQWHVQDDVVMGGRSQGRFKVNEQGHGVFWGDVSLENGGGFSSVMSVFEPVDVSAYETAVLRIRGDSKGYRFMVKSDAGEGHHYNYQFDTSGEWEEIRIPLAAMYPSFRGMRLSIPDYPGQTMGAVRILIANKVQERFQLEIDRIWLE